VGLRVRRGFTLIEMMVVVATLGLMATIAVPGLLDMQRDQHLRSAARDIADALQLARAHAIRTGNDHIAIFQGATGEPVPARLRTSHVIDVVDDGVASSADCTIANAEVIYSVSAEGEDLRWGTTSTLAGANPVPTDGGLAPTNVFKGSSFTDATVTTPTTSASKFASWVVFQPDGIPRLLTPTSCSNVGSPGSGGGAIYLTNGRRDYAVVLSPFGAVRVHHWIRGRGWSE